MMPVMEKHILILTTTSDFLGKFERENVKILQQMGYIVHYAANMKEPYYVSTEENLRQMGIQTHHIEIARSPFLMKENQKAFRQLLHLIHSFPIQAIHCHTPVGGLLGRLAGKFCPDKNLIVIYTAHGFHFYKGSPLFNRMVYYPVEKKLARYTDILIVINEEDYRATQKFRIKKDGHVYKIPGVGLDRDLFRPFSKERRNFLRKQFGIDQDIFFLLSIGELNENKNHQIVLEALAKMKQEQKDLSKLKYGICGDGFFREQIQQQIKEFGLENTVTLYGYCDRISEILGCCDATIFPSRREGLGMAGLESLSMGIPVIASDNRGTREYMEHGKNGFVYRYDDVDGFIEGIETLRNLNSEKKKEMKLFCTDSVKSFDKQYATAVMKRIYSGVDRRIEQEFHEEKRKNQCHHGCI